MNKTYLDARGVIEDIAEGDFKAIQLITSMRGAVRSNHYHKTGGHLLYVLSGSMLYREREVGKEWVSERIVKQGQQVFTGPMMVHETRFLEDTVLLCASTVLRGEGAYDEDLVRENVSCQEA